MKTVGQFYQDNSYVDGHRHEHLAYRLGLRVACLWSYCATGGDQFCIGQLGHAINQSGDFRPKFLFDVGYLDILVVFDDIVEQRGREGVCVELQIGKEQRGLQRVDDERFAGQPHLAVVSGFGEIVGRGDYLKLVFGHIIAGFGE